MPFAGPETALASTIAGEVVSKVIAAKFARPGASQSRSTTSQSLTDNFNDLHQDSTTYEIALSS
jgi:hypothetical protein